MTVKKIIRVTKLQGTQAERLVENTDPLENGSTFTETDTGDIYEFDQDQGWFKSAKESVSISGSIPAGTNNIGEVSLESIVEGYLSRLNTKNPTVNDSYTRPDNTTAYAAYYVVSDSTSSPSNLEFATGLTSGSSVLITSAMMRIDIAAIPSGMEGFRIALFESSPTAINDNSPFDVVNGDKDKFLGYIDLPTPNDLGSRLWTQIDGINMHVQMSGTSIYAQLVTKGAYTPSSGDVFKVYLSMMELKN